LPGSLFAVKRALTRKNPFLSAQKATARGASPRGCVFERRLFVKNWQTHSAPHQQNINLMRAMPVQATRNSPQQKETL
jgi:hypothetical protein